MALLLLENPEEPAPIVGGRAGKGQQCPGEELHGLQLVVGEGVQDPPPLVGIVVSLDRWHPRLADRPNVPAAGPAGILDAQGRPGLAVLEVIGQGGQLELDVLGEDQGFSYFSYLHGFLLRKRPLPAL